MSQALNDLNHIRGQFEELQRKMCADTNKAVAKYGMENTATILADVARIQADMHRLAINLNNLEGR